MNAKATSTELAHLRLHDLLRTTLLIITACIVVSGSQRSIKSRQGKIRCK